MSRKAVDGATNENVVLLLRVREKNRLKQRGLGLDGKGELRAETGRVLNLIHSNAQMSPSDRNCLQLYYVHMS